MQTAAEEKGKLINICVHHLIIIIHFAMNVEFVKRVAVCPTHGLPSRTLHPRAHIQFTANDILFSRRWKNIIFVKVCFAGVFSMSELYVFSYTCYGFSRVYLGTSFRLQLKRFNFSKSCSRKLFP